MILQSNGQQGEKQAKMQIQTFEYLENEKSIFNEIKTIVSVFEGLLFGEKIKNR